MPYIKQADRKKYNNLISKSVCELSESGTAGDLNYFISSVVWQLFDLKKSYSNANELIGVLECVKQEFYRRRVAPYEEEKIKENGDI